MLDIHILKSVKYSSAICPIICVRHVLDTSREDLFLQPVTYIEVDVSLVYINIFVICSALTQLGLKNCVKRHWMFLCFILFCPLQHTRIVYPPACWLSLLQLSNLISSPIGLQKWIKHLFIQHVCAFDWCFALFVLSQSCAHFVINWALFGRHFALFNSLKGKILLFRSAALRVINYDGNKRCLCCASKPLPVQGIFLC